MDVTSISAVLTRLEQRLRLSHFRRVPRGACYCVSKDDGHRRQYTPFALVVATGSSVAFPLDDGLDVFTGSQEIIIFWLRLPPLTRLLRCRSSFRLCPLRLIIARMNVDLPVRKMRVPRERRCGGGFGVCLDDLAPEYVLHGKGGEVNCFARSILWSQIPPLSVAGSHSPLCTPGTKHGRSRRCSSAVPRIGSARRAHRDRRLRERPDRANLLGPSRAPTVFVLGRKSRKVAFKAANTRPRMYER